MLQHLKKFFGYDSFRPVQEEVIKTVLNKQDTLLLMPTGGGKSICFQIPALMQEGLCLVISPLIALMKDQVMGLLANGVPAAFLNSSLNASEEDEVIANCRSGQTKLLYISPEKAVKLRKEFYDQLNVSMIAIDEAHCISSWGHDFRPEYAQLKLLREMIPGVSIIALTATADKVTRRDIITQLQLRQPKVFIASFDRPNLSLKVVANAKEKNKISDILELIRKYPNDSGIVYCLSRSSTEKLTDALKESGIKAACYHAGLENAERTKSQEAFINDDIQVICATVAFGMGIDKSNVRFVVHFNLPKNIESYYQEIGRAGRDGLPSETILFYGLGDLRILREFAEKSERREFNLEKLKMIEEYADARICRRKILLNYFSENITHDCGNCDVCKNPPKFIDGTLIAQKALSAVIRMDQKCGTLMLINVLRGSQNADVLEKGYDKIKTFGAGADLSYDVWRSYIMQFIQMGVFEMAYDENYALHITEFGNQVLYGQLKVHLVRQDARTFASRKKPESSGEKTFITRDRDSLFEELRKYRLELANKEHFPPFIIFSDNTLKMMERFQPVAGNAMLQIPGVSQVKMNKYGEGFINIIKNYIEQHGFTPVPSPVERIKPEILKGYLDEMKKAGSRLTYTQMSAILRGAERESITENDKKLSFYGKMEGETTAKAIREQLKNFFIAFVDTPVNDMVETFFAPPFYNNMDETEGKNLFRQLRQIPIQRPSSTINNDYILEQRIEFPRAYEPWGDQEINLYMRAIDSTNDLGYLCRVFQRNPGSMKQMFKKLKAETGVVQ